MACHCDCYFREALAFHEGQVMVLLRSSLASLASMTGAAFAALLLLSPGPAFAGIQGSAHDFSLRSWSKGEICIVCHTPHRATAGLDAPLWNHQVSVAAFTLYSSPTMQVTAEQPSPGSSSRMCLSCHDGSVAVDAFGGASGSVQIASRANLTTDLSNDHPIGIEWAHQTGLSAADPHCMTCHDVTNPRVPTGKELRFFKRKVECASCHDVHNSKVMDVKLLRKPLAGSQICLHCHPK